MKDKSVLGYVQSLHRDTVSNNSLGGIFVFIIVLPFIVYILLTTVSGFMIN